MMTEERIAELRRCNTMHYSTTTGGMQQGGWSAELAECLDEIERLKADHDASVTQWTIFLAEQRAEIERLRRELDEATTDRDAWESKARSLAAECGYANPDYLEAEYGDDD